MILACAKESPAQIVGMVTILIAFLIFMAWLIRRYVP